MKKIAAIILTICFASSSVISFAQDKAFAPKTNSVSAGIGFGYTSNYVSGTTSTPVFTGIYEYGFKQAGPGVLGLGGLISFQNSNYEFVSNQGNFEESWGLTYIGARCSWHPDVLVGEKYDVFAAAQLGYQFINFSYSGTGIFQGAVPTNSVDNSLVFGAVFGGRYYFTKTIGVFAELGWDISYSKFGIQAKF